MIRSVAVAATILCLSAPALADPAAAPKMKKTCKAVNNGNPLFPTYRCTSVPVETAAAPAPAAAPAATAAAEPAQPATQVAMQNGAAPH